MVWRCSKCGNTMTSTLKPLVGTCVKGGGHRWSQSILGGPRVNWRCGKCGNVTVSGQRPLDRPCRCGGNCSWRKS